MGSGPSGTTDSDARPHSYSARHRRSSFTCSAGRASTSCTSLSRTPGWADRSLCIGSKSATNVLGLSDIHARFADVDRRRPVAALHDAAYENISSVASGTTSSTSASFGFTSSGTRFDVQLPPRRSRVGLVHLAEVDSGPADGSHVRGRCDGRCWEHGLVAGFAYADGRHLDPARHDGAADEHLVGSDGSDEEHLGVVRVHLERDRLDVLDPARLDGAAWASCTSPKSYSGWRMGRTFEVAATDAAGQRCTYRRRAGRGDGSTPRTL